MLFNTLSFALFLVIGVAGHHLLKGRSRLHTVWLLVLSYGFYASWDVRYLALILASTLLDYSVGKGLAKSDDPSRRRTLLLASISGNLLLLGTFKYGNFVLENLEWASRSAGLAIDLPRIDAALPVGISFYTFQTLSYTIDLYRKKIEPAKNLREFALFVAFFPQLVAGPIVRAAEFLPQVHRRPRQDRKAVGEGIALILVGLFKKMVIADTLRHRVVVPFFETPDAYTAIEAIPAMWATYFQIYYDFSGYTDVALGAALLFGFRLPQNFDRPGRALSPLAHWQRWHITLQTWLRDYVYIPMGGSRNGAGRNAFNIVAVFVLGGLWHGAGWTFLAMGLYNGLLCIAWKRLLPLAPTSTIGRLGRWFFSFNLVAASVIFLHAASISEAQSVIAAMFRGGIFADALSLGGTQWWWLWAAVAIHLSPRRWKQSLVKASGEAPAFALAVAILACAAILYTFAEYADRFYYFQF